MTTNHPPPTNPSTAMDVEALRKAASELLDACIEDFGLTDDDTDEEAVAGGEDGPVTVKFGHLRRLEVALAQAPQAATVEREGWQDICDFCPDLGAPTREPSIRQAMRQYYRYCFNERKSSSLAELYCDAITTALAAAPTAPTAPEHDSGDGLTEYLKRQWAWSKETFGPDLRTKGVIQHITKELREIEADPHDLSEWVDVIILAMDGFWRHGGAPEDLLPRMQAKQDKNFARSWPDWRTMGEDQAIEHDRSGDAARLPTPDPGIAARLGELDAKAPRGAWKVICSEIGDGPDRRPIAFLVDANDEDRIFAVDEEPEALEHISPALELAAELVNAWRSGALTATPARPVVEGERDASAGPSPWPEPWKRCPSTHCERAEECRSPHDCIVRKAPSTTRERHSPLGMAPVMEPIRLGDIRRALRVPPLLGDHTRSSYHRFACRRPSMTTSATLQPDARPDEASLREALAEEVIRWASLMAPFWWLAPCAERFVRDHIRPILDANADLMRRLEEAEARVGRLECEVATLAGSECCIAEAQEPCGPFLSMQADAERFEALAARVPALEAALSKLIAATDAHTTPRTSYAVEDALAESRAVLSSSEGGRDGERG